MTDRPSNAGYSEDAANLLQRYESFASEQVHAQWRDLIPAEPSRMLDIGAGTGRDAAWFVSLGHSVVAVEPTEALRQGGRRLHPEPEITWLDDRLPALPRVLARRETFDLVMLNAVWMHLTEDERQAGMATITPLMAPGARLFMSQRHGPVPEGRRMFDVSGEETIALATANRLTVRYHARSGSLLAENQTRGVEWTCLVFEKP